METKSSIIVSHIQEVAHMLTFDIGRYKNGDMP